MRSRRNLEIKCLTDAGGLTKRKNGYIIKVSNDTFMGDVNLPNETNARIESELEVKAYIQDLKFALNNGAKIDFQAKRRVDDSRDEKFTNQYTVNTLFPNENSVDALKRELLSLSVEDYMQTVKDLRFPKRSEMREFGKVYNGSDDVYIKIRVELLGMYGQTTTFVMFFHFAEKTFTPEMFPYRKN